jgi:SSS family solute:Na+ symporter
LQTLPAVVLGLFTRYLHPRALLVGWAVGIVAGTAMSVSQRLAAVYPLRIAGTTISAYAAVYAVILNLAVASAGMLLAVQRLKGQKIRPSAKITTIAALLSIETTPPCGGPTLLQRKRGAHGAQ